MSYRNKIQVDTVGAGLVLAGPTGATGSPGFRTLASQDINAVAWGLTGNLGTNGASSFVGTTDAQPLNFGINGAIVAQLSSSGILKLGYYTASGISGTERYVINDATGSLSDFSFIAAGGGFPTFNLGACSGTPTARTALAATGTMGNHLWWGYDGATWIKTAEVIVKATSVATGAIPSTYTINVNGVAILSATSAGVTLSGTPNAVTQLSTDNSIKIATTAFVQSVASATLSTVSSTYAPLLSPTLTTATLSGKTVVSGGTLFLPQALAAYASLNFNNAGTNPGIPAAGDMWASGQALYFNNGTTNVNLTAMATAMTTAGDMVYESSPGNPTRLAIGTLGQILGITSGHPAWINNTALANPMTTVGDMVYSSAGSTPARLAGNSSTVMAILTQTGNGATPLAPIWTTTTGTAGSVVLSTSPTLTTPTLTGGVTFTAGKATFVASSTSYASFNLPAGSPPTTPANGDVWYDSTQKTLASFINGVNQDLIGVIWTKTATTALSNWTTAATILGAVGTGVGTLTLPANFLVVGKVVRLRLKGIITTTGSAPTLTIAVTLGGVSLGTTGATALTTGSMSGRTWQLDFEFTCRTTGASGTVLGAGMFNLSNTATLDYAWGVGTQTASTVNTTTALAIDVTAACGTSNANNGINCSTATIEILN